mgnify:CR=1 FL=1
MQSSSFFLFLADVKYTKMLGKRLLNIKLLWGFKSIEICLFLQQKSYFSEIQSTMFVFS